MTDPCTFATLDANEAVARAAYALSETIAIYPITPSSPMAEHADEWSGAKRPNAWGDIPTVVQMQSEGGVAGAVHGMLQAGSMSTTFTASQGLLLMIPNMYKIAGELLPFTMHVSARTLATHALSIFGDHSDVMSCRHTGFAMLCANSVQEAHDFAGVAHAATLQARVPFLHFFDGFRTSHEVNKIRLLDTDTLSGLIDMDAVARFRAAAMTPDRPSVRGTAANPDTFFQAREACNPFHEAVPQIVGTIFDKLHAATGRRYSVVEYYGAENPERIVVAMGSGAETAEEYIDWAVANGESVGLIKVRLYRPFPAAEFLRVLPPSVRRIAVLDRTKEPGAPAEPLCQDVMTVLAFAAMQGRLHTEGLPVVVGGRYGLSSKEFTPAMVKAVLDNLMLPAPKNGFSIGIEDDVSRQSLRYDREFDIESNRLTRAVFYGLGSDGTVGANKNSIKIIGGDTENFAQGYFVYDSKKSGSMTVSHLRFGPDPIRSAYLIRKADFVACHHAGFLERLDVLERAEDGATFLLNCPGNPDEVWDRIPTGLRNTIRERRLKVFAIDAAAVAAASGMGSRINTIMQTCFFAISNVLPREEAIACIKAAIEKTYSRKGDEVLRRNFEAVDRTLDALHEIEIPTGLDSEPLTALRPAVPPEAPEFVQRVTAVMLTEHGDDLPVSAFPPDGIWPSGTSRWEKRGIAAEIPAWDPDICIQCNKCVIVCPHAAIRAKFYEPECLHTAPAGFQSAPFRSTEDPGQRYTIQIAPEDCTGCALCINVCPAKDKTNPRHKALDPVPLHSVVDTERDAYAFFLDLPNPDRTRIRPEVKSSQFLEPLFEYSGACAGCGETPYIKLLTQLFGDRLVIANATGCSSIYGGNLPTTPYTVNRDGRGPAWANSLFEDNAEFGLGLRLGVDFLSERARRLVRRHAPLVGDDLVTRLLDAPQQTEEEILSQRGRVAELRRRLAKHGGDPDAVLLLKLADYLVRKSVWILGGDGWAYDIGFGGLDHILASRHDVNILVLDTQVYSNTGGQCSKATPLGAVAKFAAGGKSVERKDLGLMAMSYGHVYVASVAMGAKDGQTVTALHEAETYSGPSLVIAYSHCIAHGYNLSHGLDQQKLAVASGFWPLFRYDPRRAMAGERGFKLDSGKLTESHARFAANETRFRMLEKVDPERARQLAGLGELSVQARHRTLETLASGGLENGKPRETTTQAEANS